MATSKPPLPPWLITVPSMLRDAPMVVVSFREDMRYGHIEIPLPPQVIAVDENGAAVHRARCPIDATRLAHISNIMRGWPFR